MRAGQVASPERQARPMSVAERFAYMGRRVMRERPDLVVLIRDGSLTIRRAYKLTAGKASPVPLERLLDAWNDASEEDREWLLDRVSGPPA